MSDQQLTPINVAITDDGNVVVVTNGVKPDGTPTSVVYPFKTIDGRNLIGSGNISIPVVPKLATINGTRIDEGGNINIDNGSEINDTTVNAHSTWSSIRIQDAIKGKQDVLVAGANLKTIGSYSLLGAGNIPLKTIDGVSLIGTGNISLPVGGSRGSSIVDGVTSTTSVWSSAKTLETMQYYVDDIRGGVRTDLNNLAKVAAKLDNISQQVGPVGPMGPAGPLGPVGPAGPVGERGVDGKTAYESAVDGGFIGSESDFNYNLAAPKGIAGGVFIVDVLPQQATDNVGDKVYSADSYSITSASSTSPNVKVRILAITGHTNFKPVVTVNDVAAQLTILGTGPLFSGEATIVLDPNGSGVATITAKHEDNATSECTILLEAPPNIIAARFIGGYPGSQVEAKAGDRMSISISTDVDIVGYDIDNYGAFVASTGSLPIGKSHNITGLVVADRGNITKQQAFKVRVKKANGSTSAWYDTSLVGSTELTHTIALNNTYPTITFTGVDYPNGQLAIKSNESATVHHMVTNYDMISYTSSDLTIATPSTFQPSKVVTYANGTYNVTNNNFAITATRSANGAVTNMSTVVNVANAPPVITITTPAVRLRSGGNNGSQIQKHVITITSSQSLLSAPSINAPEGSWVESSWTPNSNKTTWTRSLAIHDDNIKGVYTFNSLNVISMSGMTQTTVQSGSTYTIGGFVFRTLTVPAFPNRETAIGTRVTDVSKLRCTNLSKGASGTLNFTYQATNTDTINKYTITGPSGTLNGNGDLWYNCDPANASANTTGTMRIELEETI